MVITITQLRSCVLLLIAGLALTTAAYSQAPPTIGTCPVFPADNPWNQDISSYPVHPMSDIFIAAINATSSKKALHPDFGSNPDYGIPYAVVPGTQPMVPITFDAYGDESDPGPYPIPPDANVEGGDPNSGDRHVLVIDEGTCTLYELYASRKDASDAGWTANCGAIFDLTKNKYRPDGWTSADAAGLPIFPGLVRYDEIMAGAINHAVRFTADHSQKGWIHPARHQAGKSDTTYPPMGLRLRLKADYDDSKFTGASKVLLTALKKYGMILADNGSSWFISGATNPNWDDNDLNQLKSVPGSAFEAVYTGPIKRTPDTTTIVDTTTTGIARQYADAGVELDQNFPNPARDITRIILTLPKTQQITLALYTAVGQRIGVLAQGMYEEGEHTISIQCDGLAAGTYVYRLQTEGGILSRQMTVVR